MTHDKCFQKCAVIHQGSVISDWVWVKKISLCFSKHCTTASVIMTKLISDQLSLFPNKGGSRIYSRAFWRINERNTRRADKGHANSICVSHHSTCGDWGEKRCQLCFALSVQPLEQGMLHLLLWDFAVTGRAQVRVSLLLTESCGR